MQPSRSAMFAAVLMTPTILAAVSPVLAQQPAVQQIPQQPILQPGQPLPLPRPMSSNVPASNLPMAGLPAMPSAPATNRAPSTKGLHLADLERLALAHNPTLEQTAANIEIQRSMALQAGLYPNPTLGYVGEQINAEGTQGEMQGAFLQQTIVTAGKLRLSRAKYQQQTVVAEIVAMGQQLRVINGVQTRFYEMMAMQRMIDIQGRLLENAEESLRTTRELANTGRANEADIYLAEIELNRAKINHQTVVNQFKAHWRELAAVVGVPDLQPAPLIGDLEPSGAPLEWDASLQRLLRDSPQLLQREAHIRYDELTLQREIVQPIPNINIQAAGGYNFESRNTVTTVQVGMQIPVFNRNQGTIRQAKFELARSIAEVRRMELELRSQFAKVFQQYQTAWMKAKIYSDSSLPKARRAHDVMHEMYKKRRVAWPRVVELQRNLYQVESEYTRSLLELRRAEVSIRGLLMVDGIALPPDPTPTGHLTVNPDPR